MENTDHNIVHSGTVSVDTLKHTYESMQKSLGNNDTINKYVSIFETSALECNCQGADFIELIQRKCFALTSLMSFLPNLSEDFCLTYYGSLSTFFDTTVKNRRGYQILDSYMNISTNINDKLLLLSTLTTCLSLKKINISVFEEFLPNEWRKELLLYALLFDCNLQNMEDVGRIIDKINNLDDLKTDCNRNVTEDVLTVLVRNRSNFELDIHFISDLLFAVTANQGLLVNLSKNFNKVQNEIINMKIKMIQRYFAKVDCSLSSLYDSEYYSKYPFEVIKALTKSKTKANVNNVIEIRRLLEICNIDLEKQIKMILSQNLDDPLSHLKYDISSEMAKNIISDIFPLYEKYCRQPGASNKLLEGMHLLSSSDIKCSCFNIKTKCALHHTTECCDLLYVLHQSIAKVISSCTNPSKQEIDLISILIVGINQAKRITEIINALEIIDEYYLELTDKQLNLFLSELTSDNYEQAVHKYVVAQFFPGTYIKSVQQLIEEIKENKVDGADSILEMFHGVLDCYRKNSNIIELPSKLELGNISTWDEKQISQWAMYVRKSKMCAVTDEEILAVIKRAIEVTIKLELREVQLLSVLLLIKSNVGKGRLAQIDTGEGKTLIIAVLAAYCVLKGHQVDIYTSSPLLAIPQSEEYKQFYQSCGISVTHNIQPRSSYDYNVIYGTNNSFQRDVLLDEFRKSGVRKDRKYDIAIVDEVDNMLIDGNNWILKISCDMPAMDYLKVLLASIYIQVKATADALVERDGETYYLCEENAIDEQGNIKSEIIVQEILIKGNKRDFIQKCTENHLRKLIRDRNGCDEIEEGYPEIKVPNHLRDLICKVQLKRWIRSAINVVFKIYKKDEDYILKDGKVTIVDADNTGVTKKNSQWCGGLHQFLEIKHGAKVHQENFTTNFISNVGLFSRYNSKLYGLTGTLGKDDTRLFLQQTYDVDSVIIPPFKKKQHKILKPILVVKNEARYTEIAKSCILKLRNGRAVLVIMKNIKETYKLAEVFSEQYKYDNSKIKLFKTEDDSNIIEKTLKPGEVIITTNIVGRGADIKLSTDVEENGGLHVCLTFLPLNSRVEQQNIGRTSRKGNNGTSQFILFDPKNQSMETLKSLRNNQEKNIMREATETVNRTKIKDHIFYKFCKLSDEIKGRDPEVKEIEQKAVEERFALWLILNEDKMNNTESNDVYKLFDDFKAEILEDDRANKLIKNPHMYVEIGNVYLRRKKFQLAINEYTNAILLDHCYAEHAYYNRAWANLSEYGGNIEKNEHFVNEAIKDLKKARELIQDREYGLHLLQTASKGEVFSEQVSHKLNLYGIQKNTIDLAIGPDQVALDEQIKNMSEELNNVNLPSDSKDKINECIKNLKEYKKDIGVIGRARQKKHNITIESLGDDFMPKDERDNYKHEIAEFERNGWLGGFKLTEIKPIDWLSVIGLLVIGFGQLIFGAALTVFTLGAGSTIGMGLISEGVSDIITAVKDGIINRDFNWATWALMKVINVAVSVVCAGLKAIKEAVKDVARTAYAGSKSILTQGAKAFTQLRKDGWKIVAEKIGFDLAKGVAKEIVTDLVSYGIDKAIIPMIEELIVEKVKTPIQKALIENPKVAQMLKLDEQNQNNNYKNQIKMLAHTLLTPEQNSLLKTIAIQFGTKLADKKGCQISRTVCTAFIGACDFTTFTSDFIRKMNSALDKIKVASNTDAGPLENLECTETTEDDNKDRGSEHEQEYEFTKEEDDDIDLKEYGQAEEQVRMKKKVRTTDKLSDELAGLVSSNMLLILKGKIIKPFTDMGVSYTFDKMASKLNAVDKKIENYKSLKNIVHYQNNLGMNTNDTYDMSPSDLVKVNEIIQRISNGGPAGLIHLGAISNVIKRPIAVFDENGRHKYTIGDSKNSMPVEIQFHAPKNGSGVGHFTLRDQRESQREGEGINMCLFNVIAEQTGHSPDDLKNKTVEMMQNNKTDMARQAIHIKRLEMYDSSNLLEGGAQYNGKHTGHAKDFLRNSNGIIGYGNIVKGHADKHVAYKGHPKFKLKAAADETGRNIEVYDEKGNLDYIIAPNNNQMENIQLEPNWVKDRTNCVDILFSLEKNSDYIIVQKDNQIESEKMEPIRLQSHKLKDGSNGVDYFSSLDGKQKCYLNDPNDTTFYDIIGKQTGTDPNDLKTATLSRMDQTPVPSSTTCLENDTKKRPGTGFLSEEDAAFVLHHAMQTQVVKDKLAELNKYKAGVNDTEDYKKQDVFISEKELNLQRPVYASFYKKGKLQNSWPLQDVKLVIQHYKGQENNPMARVHIQTAFPRPPSTPQPPPPPS